MLKRYLGRNLNATNRSRRGRWWKFIHRRQFYIDTRYEWRCLLPSSLLDNADDCDRWKKSLWVCIGIGRHVLNSAELYSAIWQRVSARQLRFLLAYVRVGCLRNCEGRIQFTDADVVVRTVAAITQADTQSRSPESVEGRLIPAEVIPPASLLEPRQLITPIINK